MKKKNNKGFSLIELIIAIAILVILTGLLAPQFMRYMEKSREAKDMQALDTVYGAVQTALANEDAYKDVKDGKLAELTTEGIALSALKTDSEKATGATTFSKEVKLTMGTMDETQLWTSKVVAGDGAGANDKVFVYIDPATFQVTVWIGEVEADTAPDKDQALSPTSATPTAGTTFWISK